MTKYNILCFISIHFICIHKFVIILITFNINDFCKIGIIDTSLY